MATGWTRQELDNLLENLDEQTPPIPTKRDILEAPKAEALRMGITDKGALWNVVPYHRFDEQRLSDLRVQLLDRRKIGFPRARACRRTQQSG